MKILVVSHTYIIDLNCGKLRALSRLSSDIQVTIIVPRYWYPGGIQNKLIKSQEKKEQNFRIIPISNFSKNNQGLLTFGVDVINLLREFQPDIIQVEQGAKSLAYAQLITLNKLLNLQAKNILFTWWNLPYKNKFPISLLEQYNLAHTDGLITGNKEGIKILREHDYQGKAIVLPQLGVDKEIFTPCKQPQLATKLNIQSKDFIIGFVGRFVQEKGILTLIKSLRNLKDLAWKLLLLGMGNLEQEIVSLANEIGIRERLIMITSVPHQEVASYLNLMNILVLPSETSYQFKTLTAVGWQEQFGHVLIEAMACKIPVIGSNCGAIPDVISDAGLIFPEGDIPALSHCLRQLIEQPKLAAEMAEKGYQRVQNQYTNQALAQQQLEFYNKLIMENK